MIDEKEIKAWLDKIEEEEPEPEEPRGKRGPKDFVEIYCDDDLLVLDKRAGLSVIPERDPQAPSLKQEAELRYGHLLTVHRIDRGTSGLVLFARNDESHRELNRQFREREVKKGYLVIVEGEAPEETFTVDVPIADGPRGSSKPSADGRPSVTHFSVVERFRGYTYIRAEPETGRQHQIRVHAQLYGIPLLVDPRYGAREAFFLSSIKRRYRTGKGKEELPLCDHLTLHAEKLGFVHPVTGEPVAVSADPPRDFRAVVTQLRKLRPLRIDE